MMTEDNGCQQSQKQKKEDLHIVFCQAMSFIVKND